MKTIPYSGITEKVLEKVNKKVRNISFPGREHLQEECGRKERDRICLWIKLIKLHIILIQYKSLKILLS